MVLCVVDHLAHPCQPFRLCTHPPASCPPTIITSCAPEHLSSPFSHPHLNILSSHQQLVCVMLTCSVLMFSVCDNVFVVVCHHFFAFPIGDLSLGQNTFIFHSYCTYFNRNRQIVNRVANRICRSECIFCSLQTSLIK